MTRFGYTLMTEQSGPRELVGYSPDAEKAGFDFLVSSEVPDLLGAEQGRGGQASPRAVPLVWRGLGSQR